jgi:hypothetical protein
MDRSIRDRYNASFTPERYQAFLKEANPLYDLKADFRIAETPVFVSNEFMEEVMNLFNDIKAFLTRPGLKQQMDPAVPKEFNVPNEDDKPCFVAIDFAVCEREDGSHIPQLIEMQGIASLYCYQHHLCQAYMNHFDIPKDLKYFFGGLDTQSYIKTLKDYIIGEEDPENVVMVDIQPFKQKTRIDFYHTEKDLGIKAICITDIIQEGKDLFYMLNGKKTPIHSIYNRVIYDELRSRPDIKPQFDMTSEVNLKRWMAHPNWFFKVSKYNLPFIDSEYVPKSRFLHEIEAYPKDLENYVLKPLFSFAGAGVVFNVTRDALDAVKDRSNYILQRKVHYSPFLRTPDMPAKAEIRLLCLWDKELLPLLLLARLSKGEMMGVDFNKEKTWVGSSAVFFE